MARPKIHRWRRKWEPPPLGDEAKTTRTATRPVVVIVGGGITGLSAAHELAERGCNVLVVEKEASPDGESDVGGVARSQVYVMGDEGKQSPRGLTVVLPSVETDFDDEATALRETVSKFRRSGLSESVEVEVSDATWDSVGGGLEGARRVTDRPRDAGTPRRARAWLKPDRRAPADAPGEHGFRFFPAFYRNLLDTMRRTPLLGGGPRGRGPKDPFRTVFDNLVPMDNMYVGLEDDEPPLHIPRRTPRSLEELFQTVDEMYRRLKFEPRDAMRFQYELLRWMTASGQRRAAWSTPQKGSGKKKKSGSWWDHIDAARYSKDFQEQLRATTMALVGMREGEIDARTYGNVCVQLLLDQLGHGDRVDYSLNGPTSEAWFEHWKAYLERLGVVFVVGKLEGWRLEDGELVPTWAGGTLTRRPEPPDQVGVAALEAVTAAEARGVVPDPRYLAKAQEYGERLERRKHQDEWVAAIVSGERKPTYWISALPLPELFRTVKDLARTHRKALDSEEAGGFRQILHWLEEAKVPDGEAIYDPNKFKDQVPFRTMAGVQFLSEDLLHVERGHLYLPKSKWWLSALVQTNHWRVREGHIRGVLSVDVSGFDQPGGPRGDGKTALQCTRGELADEVLRQLVIGRGGGKRLRQLPQVSHVHVDDYLEYDKEGKVLQYNKAPYLINLPGQWELRPGTMDEKTKKPAQPDEITYPIGFGRWILAGPHCKTWTRLATMEAANESARHAANAVLDGLRGGKGHGGAWGRKDPNASGEYGHWRGCSWAQVPVVNLEDNELDDLTLFREVDEQLMKDGVPHLFEVLKLDELVDELLGSSPEAKAASALEDAVRRRLGLGTARAGSAAAPIGQLLSFARRALEGLRDAGKK